MSRKPQESGGLALCLSASPASPAQPRLDPGLTESSACLGLIDAPSQLQGVLQFHVLETV